MSKVALVVDDSRLARHVLSKLLADHGIVADMAESAEEALEYLKHSRPDVVFMDHMMPGMDGFEALEAIKANPATATIPVMMYTSQEGGLYVGQARALGAFGVLPKDLKPTEVATVLKALHLTPDDEARGAPDARRHDRTERYDPDLAYRVEDLLQELFYQQRAALREEIRQGYQQAVESVQVPVLSELDIKRDRSPSVTPVVAIGIVVVAALVLGLLYIATDRALVEERLRSTQLLDQMNQASAVQTIAMGEAADAAVAALGPVPSPLLRVIERAALFDSHYGFDEIALDDERADQIDVIVRQLEEAGFRGTVFIDVHAGRFCMSPGEALPWVLALPDVPAADCAQQGWPESEAEARGTRESIRFANMLSEIARRGRTDIQINSFGTQLPTVPYPPVSSFVTAAEWNEIAARNQRVELRFQQ